MKKVLMNASVASMIYKFNMGNIEILENMGYQVDVACNFGKGNPISEEEVAKFKGILKEKNIKMYETDCPRNIFAIGRMVKAYRQLKMIIDNGKYDFIHTQSPIGGVVCRLAAKKVQKKETKVIYTAHGFHFFKGASIFNWLIFYPIEKFLSRWTDTLITINHEDYGLAKRRFHCRNVEYIPGVGVDVNKFKGCTISKYEKRMELGISSDAFVLLSVGELSPRKNHQIVIKALGKLKDKNICYLIAGKGEGHDNYLQLAKYCGVADQIKLLGARTDVDELCVAADIFVHPSVREGLGIAPLEGMAAGLPLISSYVNGIKDYTENGVTGVCVLNPLDVDEVKGAIIRLRDDGSLRVKCSINNKRIVGKFSVESSQKVMKKIYQKMSEGYSYL